MSDDTPPQDPGFLPPPPPPVGAGSLPPPPPPFRGPVELKAQRGLARAVALVIGIVAVLNLSGLPNDLAYLGSLQDLSDGDFSALADAEDQEDLRASLAGLALAATVVAGIVWVIWQQRARHNAQALGAGGLRHTNGLAAGGWFIPFANLAIPKQVTDDLWRATDPDAPEIFRIEGRPVWGVVSIWWALWVIGGLIGRFLFRDDPEDLDSLMTTVRVEIALTFVILAAAVLGVMVVWRITERMGQRATNAGLQLP